MSAADDMPGPLGASLSLDVYPNPFNPSTTIAYEVPKAGPVVLRLFDICGRMVDEIVRGEIQSATTTRSSTNPAWPVAHTS